MTSVTYAIYCPVNNKQSEKTVEDFTNYMEEHLRAQLASFDEIIASTEAVPFDSIELSGIIGAVNQWCRDRRPVSPKAISWTALNFSDDEQRKFWGIAVTGGWIPFLVENRRGEPSEFRLVKVRVGRSILGRVKHVFRLYQCAASGRFVFLSEHKSTLMAMWALSKSIAP